MRSDASAEPPGLSTRTTSALRFSLGQALLDHPRDGLAAGATWPGLAVDDLAGDGHDADRALGPVDRLHPHRQRA